MCRKFKFGGEISIATLFAIFEIEAEEHRLNNNLKVRVVRTLLEGYALEQYFAYFMESPKYNKKNLVSYFEDLANTVICSIYKSYDRTQGIEEYYGEKLNMGRRLNLPPEIIVEGFSAGLPYNLQVILSARDSVATPAEWVRISRKLSRLARMRHQ